MRTAIRVRLFVDNDEVRQTDEEGFIRGDAVSLSARLLSTNYAKNGDESDRSVAEKLIDDGDFHGGTVQKCGMGRSAA